MSSRLWDFVLEFVEAASAVLFFCAFSGFFIFCLLLVIYFVHGGIR